MRQTILAAALAMLLSLSLSDAHPAQAESDVSFWCIRDVPGPYVIIQYGQDRPYLETTTSSTEPELVPAPAAGCMDLAPSATGAAPPAIAASEE